MQLVTEENITELAMARWGTAHDPRLAEVMQALVRHLHELAPFHIEGSPHLGDGAYEAVLQVDEARLRGKYTSTPAGAYCVRTIAPLGYSIPMDGPVGELISRTDISHYRPAHVHSLIDVPGYQPLITHLFPEGAAYLDSDVVFGAKSELVVEFARREPGPTPDGGTCAEPWLLAVHDFVLQPSV